MKLLVIVLLLISSLPFSVQADSKRGPAMTDAILAPSDEVSGDVAHIKIKEISNPTSQNPEVQQSQEQAAAKCRDRLASVRARLSSLHYLILKSEDCQSFPNGVVTAFIGSIDFTK